MVVSLKANRKRIIAFFILAVIVAGVCFFLWQGKEEGEEPGEIAGGTNEERISFLESFGWEVNGEPTETREVMIPQKFNDVYTTYNVMQKAQGFDLKPYAGEVCTQYQYKINNYPNEDEVYATLLVYGDRIIGGDVACSEVDGFMHGFAKGSAHYGETVEKAESSGESGSEAPPESQKAAEEESAVESGVESTAGEPVAEGGYPTD